jgi:hypothetical protein
MGHQQYRDSLLERLRRWCVANPGSTISDARRELRASLSDDDIDLLFDNWLNANFDRIEVKTISENSHTAVIRPLRKGGERSAEAEAAQRRTRDSIASRMASGVKSNLFEEFSARIWETILPNGVRLLDAKGADMKHAGGWFSELAKRVGATEKVSKHFTTQQLFDLSQRSAFRELAVV